MNTSKLKITDISNDLAINPLTGDISIKKDQDAIRQSLKNLLLMEQFDKPFNPNIQAGLRKYLFENIPFPILENLVEQTVRELIQTYETRVEVKKVDIGYGVDQNVLQIDITYSIKNSTLENEQVLQIYLERIR